MKCRVPPRCLNLEMHSVRHRQQEGGEERNSKEVLTSLLCMQRSSVWHLPKCKGVLPSPSLWFGSAPWSRSNWTRNKETKTRQSLPSGPQVRPTGACGSHQASVQLISFLTRQGFAHQCRRTQHKAMQGHCSWAL